MIFSAIVSVFLFGLIVYALLQKREFPLVGRVMPPVALFGIYVVWFPDTTSDLASTVGIGRGVDLVLYVWVLASGLILLALHVKLIAYERKLTELARYFALHAALPPLEADKEAPSTSHD